MCGSAPKAPDNSAAVAEQQRQFEIEQQRLKDQMAQQQADALAQRTAEEQRYQQQLALQKAQQDEAARQYAEQQALQQQQYAEQQAQWQAQQEAAARQREIEQQRYDQSLREATDQRTQDQIRYDQQLKEAQAARELQAQQLNAQVAEQQRQRQILEDQQRQAAEAAAAKQAAIDSATGAITGNFSKYDDAYFNKFKQDYVGYYTPEVDKQLADARKQTEYSLARRGLTDSSAASDAYARLTDADATQRAKIAQQAEEQALALRNQINQQRDLLLAQATASGGGKAYVDSSAGYTPAVSQKSALGDLFSSLVTTSPTQTNGVAPSTLTGGSTLTPAGATAGGDSSTLVGAVANQNIAQQQAAKAAAAKTNTLLTA